MRRRAILSSLLEEDFDFIYNENYLTIGALRDGLEISAGFDCYYSIDGSDSWQLLTAGVKTPKINAGQCISFKGNRPLPDNDTPEGFIINGRCCLLGNCMSILYEDNVTLYNEVPVAGLAYLFAYCSDIITISENFLPATVLNASCYYAMFLSCTKLTNAPNLPATVLADGCYYCMFGGCSMLKEPPELPATEISAYCYARMFIESGIRTSPDLPSTDLKPYCYDCMFGGCKNIKSTPELNATTLAQYCYREMFSDCISLVNAHDLNADIISNYAYASMFKGCTSLVYPPKIKASKVYEGGCSSMFYGCIKLISPPELKATTIYRSCYSSMFYGCTNLEYAPELPATTLESSCYSSMFYNCQNMRTTPELPAKNFSSGCYNYMFYGCRKIKLLKILIESKPYNSLDNYIYNILADTDGGIICVSDTATWYENASNYLNTSLWTFYTESEYNNAQDKDYLYIEAVEDNISFKFDNDLEYSIDECNTWKTLQAGVYSDSIIAGNRAYIRANAYRLSTDNGSYIGLGTFKFFGSTAKKFNVGGSPTSLIWGTGGIYIVPTYTCANLFKDCMGLISAENMIFPQETKFLGSNCCFKMFCGCKNLITSPRLNAMNLSVGCYQHMFNGCSSLVNVSDLPATNLKSSCYWYMFCDCTSLTKAPDLLAVDLDYSGSEYSTNNTCYYGMFSGCTNLQYIKAMFVTDPTAGSEYNWHTKNWVYNVSPTGVFVKNSEATWSVFGVNGIPEGWTIEYADY